MTDEQKLFLAAYPLFPAPLLDKFSSVLVYELAKFNGDIAPDLIKKYILLQSPIEKNISADDAVRLYQPKQAKEQRTDFSYAASVYYWRYENGQFGQDAYYTSNNKLTVYYDSRLFFGALASFSTSYVDTGEVIQLATQRYVEGSFFTPGKWISEYTPVLRVAPIFKASIIGTLKDYGGAESALAMLENGIYLDAEYELLKQFVSFINGYKKYNGQLSASMSLQAEKSKQDMVQYQNALSDKLAARKNELNDLKTQIAFAAQNETNSAKRDMQNLALNAQSLILQLQEKIQ